MRHNILTWRLDRLDRAPETARDDATRANPSHLASLGLGEVAQRLDATEHGLGEGEAAAHRVNTAQIGCRKSLRLHYGRLCSAVSEPADVHPRAGGDLVGGDRRCADATFIVDVLVRVSPRTTGTIYGDTA